MQTARRVALVTGGVRGIGLGIAQALARAGWNLVLSHRRESPEAEAAAAELRGLGVEVWRESGDISAGAARAQLLASARCVFGRLDALINNAGMAPEKRADMLEAEEEGFARVLRVNLQGPYFLTQAAARWMIEQRRDDPAFQGYLVNISSVSAEVASPTRGEYCISKAGLSMSTKLWAVRLAEYGIAVYEIRPGLIATEMTAGVREKYDRLIASGALLEARWGRPEDIGRAVVLLLEGGLSYATGQTLTLDGGLTLPRL